MEKHELTHPVSVGEAWRQTQSNDPHFGLYRAGNPNFCPKNEEADNRHREWKDFPVPAARWTLNRV
jgi:hypothetical protein